MVHDRKFDSEFVGRVNVFNELKNKVNESLLGNGQFSLISGEAGIGKTRVVLELQKYAGSKSVNCLKGSCIYHDVSDPYLPFITALSKITSPQIVDESQKYVMINEAFLINDAGKVVSYASRMGANIMDEDIVGGMLSAVEAFVRDAFGDGESSTKRLDTLVYGPIRVYIEHGKHIFLAVVLSGAEPEGIRGDLKKMVKQIEKNYHDVLEDWDGDLAKVSGINDIVQKLTLVRYKIKRGIRDIDIKKEKDRVFEKVLQLLKRASQKDPLMLILEDIHWADSSSLQLLSYIARNTKDCRIFICGTYRPEELDDTGEKKIHPLKEMILRMSRDKVFHSFELGRLPSEEVSNLLQSRFDSKDISKEFIDQIFTQTEGNPFFIEEVLRSLEDEGIIQNESGGWSINEITDVNLPSTIKDLIELRINRLDEHSMDTIKQASVIGREFDFVILEKTTGMDDEKLVSSLETLEKRKLIEEASSDAEIYRFSHSMIREVIYNGISIHRKRMMHENVGNAILELNKTNLDTVIYELARHFSNTRDYKKAFEYSVKAGEKASIEFAENEAFDFFLLAMKAINRLDETVDTNMAKLMVATYLGDISYVIGKWDSAFEYYDIVEKLSKELGDEKTQAEAYRGLGLIYANKNEWEKAQENLTAALEISQNIQDQHGIADTFYSLGSVFERKGEFSKALQSYGDCMDFAVDIKDSPEIARAYMGIGRVYAQQGEYEESVDSFKKVVEIQKKRGDLDGLAMIYANLGATYNYLDPNEAIRYHNLVIDLVNRTGNIRMKGYALMNLSYSLLLKKENLNEIPTYLESALVIFNKLDEKMAISSTYVNFGSIYKFKKEWDRSQEYFERAITICKELNTPYNLGNVLYEYGTMFKEKGDNKNAQEKFNESLSIYEGLKNEKMIEKIKKEIGN